MNKLDCTECHDKLFTNASQHSKVEMEAMSNGTASCGNCHNGGRAFTVTGNCKRCHRKS